MGNFSLALLSRATGFWWCWLGIFIAGGSCLAAERGALANFTSVPSGATDARRDRLIALSVPAGAAPTALLVPGAFRVAWETSLAMPLRGEVTFSFEGTGTAQLRVNGELVLEETGPALGGKASAPVRLNKGANQLAVSYESPAPGKSAARFRLYWAGRDFGREPIPPTLLTYEPSSEPLRAANRVREGRALFAGLHCASCHDSTALAAGGNFSELAEASPSLEEAGARFRADWIAAWIADPKKIRPDTTMPRVPLAAPRDAADIAAYLSTLGRPAPAPALSDDLVPDGAKLFVDLQCIACHALPGQVTSVGTAADELTRVSLLYVKSKWQPAALVAFLKNPADYHSAIRMPNFNLADGEARALAAFLLSREGGVPPKSTGDSVRGKMLFHEAGCAQCHGEVERVDSNALSGGERDRARWGQHAAPLGKLDWTRGCLADAATGRGGAPDFALDGAAREALRAFGSTGMASLRQDVSTEYAERQFVALRCAACHARDGRESIFSALGAEASALKNELAVADATGESAPEESVDQDPPSLTWAGEKLKLDFLRRQIAGEIPWRARPWLKARMPAFRSRAAGIAEGLTDEHGMVREDALSASLDVAKAKIGGQLVGPDAFNCATCHAIGSQPAAAPFGSPGINFVHAYERLRFEWMQRWLDNPPRISPATKMPKFTDVAGRSTQPTFLNGDAHAQWDAIYAYLRRLNESAPR